MTVDVFQYRDLGAFLRDVYEAKKASSRGFSYRAFSRRIGVKSPNHLKRVIDGERNLPDAMARTYARALGLKGEAATYFCDLARFSRAKTPSQKEEAWRAMMHSARYREAHQADVKFARYCAHWYLPAIRELAGCVGFDARPAWIARQLVPRISTKEASEAIETLIDLGLLRRTATGGVERSDTMVTTGAETRGVHIPRYHRSMLERAAESMELVEGSERDISSVTLCVASHRIPELKAEIQAFRKRLMQLAEDAPDPDRVVQFNVQLFPLSRTTR